MMMMNDEMIARIDRIMHALFDDYARDALIIDIANHDSIDDYIDALIDDDFAIIDESINDDDIALIRNCDEFAIALRDMIHSRAFAIIMNR
jgi:hypothetical protein